MYLIGPIPSRTFLVHVYGMATKQTDPQYKLRLPPELKERIEKAALENKRSMNAEIVARLESTFEDASASERLFTRAEVARIVQKAVDDAMSLLIRDFSETFEDITRKGHTTRR